MPAPRGSSDEEILRLLREVEEAEDHVDDVALEAEREEPAFDPCPACGEPAQYLGECHACSEAGCLPRDDWAPGMRDPCLTLCVRCARTLHLGCSVEDAAGNPRCATCPF